MRNLAYPSRILEKRRHELLNQIDNHSDIILLFNAPYKTRSYDTHFPYRPDSDFIYLSGFTEENSAIMLWKEKPNKVFYQIFVLPKNPQLEHWNGVRVGPLRAKKLTGAFEAFEISQLEAQMLKWLESRKKGSKIKLWSNAKVHFENQIVLDRILEKFNPTLRLGYEGIDAAGSAHAKIRKMRTIKDATEISVLRKASQINVEAHLDVIHHLKPGLRENQVQSIIEWNYHNAGCTGNAYYPICASGVNATCLHYNDNCDEMKAGELLLLDAGCEYNYFASDITRTLPISGTYTPAQRWAMDLVAEAHAEVIRAVKPGLKYTRMHEIAAEVITEGLVKKKFLKGSVAKLQKENAFRKYFTHGTGHWMGMDVHDPCPYVDDNGDTLKLKPGMVFTVEPGLYFAADNKSVPKEFRGIGIRIEDDILVTSKGCENLTLDLPRYAEEIENEMALQSL